MADSENVKILGINDFYVTEGYKEFIEMCRLYHIFPLLNFELIGISREDQESGIRVNDPGNPGRCLHGMAGRTGSTDTGQPTGCAYA